MNLGSHFLLFSFPEELPSRVWKEILRAADENHDGYISMEEAQHALKNIGASDKLTPEELTIAMQELGAVDGKVEVQVLKDLLSDQRGMGHGG